MNTQNNQTQNQQKIDVGKFEETIVVASWRRTGMGGISHPIGLKLSNGKLVLIRPMRKEYSRSGNHGRWFYLRDEVDVLIYLEQSNSGRRSIILSICRLPPETCGRIADTAETLWVGFGASTAEVEKALTLLQL